MSTAKKIAKVGVGATAAVFGLGALVYEGALNTKLAVKFAEIFSKSDNEQDASHTENCYTDGQSWFDAHKGEDKVIFTEKTGNTHAYVIINETPSDKWVVLNHGYTSSPEGTGVYAEKFYEWGYNCISPSLRGWSNDENHYCSMGYHDKDICIAWINYIVCNYPNAKIVIHGYSMGAATTMNATGETLPSNVLAAVSDCGYTNCYEQYKYVLKYNASIPAFPLLDAANAVSILRRNFNFKKSSPIDAVKRSKTPTLFIHGSADDFVPFYMLDEVYNACAAPKDKLVVEGALHAASVQKDPELYWTAVENFLSKYVK